MSLARGRAVPVSKGLCASLSALLLVAGAAGVASAAGPTARQLDKPLWAFGGAGYSRALDESALSGSVGLQAGFWHRLPAKPFAVGGEIGWFSLGSGTRHERLAAAGMVTQDYSRTTVPVTLQGWLMAPAGGREVPMATAGAGLYSVRTVVENRRTPGVMLAPKETKGESAPGLNAGAGVGLPTPGSVLRFGFDARFHWVFLEGGSLQMLTVLLRYYL